MFCRLNHPEEYIRESISELLCRIARDFPHLIIYPAVVGSQDGPTKIETVSSTTNNDNLFENLTKSQQQELAKQDQNKNEQDLDSENEQVNSNSQELSEENAEQDVENVEAYEEEEMSQEENKNELKSAYKYLLDTLAESNPKVIDQVKLFVHEMRRITLLREELWYGTLNQIHSDLNKRIEQLNAEITKLNSNQSNLNQVDKKEISKEKYEILLHPIVSILEHVHEITTDLSAETPNEEQFQLEFGSKILDALEQLKDTQNAFKPSNACALFKQLHANFHHRSQRRHSNALLLDQISPKLAALKSTVIPIPGKDGHNCTIYSIANSVHILPTKTKPKKLYFIGSNGKRYAYLFKGLEDLHLDERIMQLLSIINSMFCKINKTETIHYNALNYSVTPLGPRSGLISWVEGATPLFTLYKKWQQREAIHLATKQNQQIHILRPNDIYYSKLNPLLKEKNIKNFHENRNECPVAILRQVLEELIKETPGDLLSKELWCNSSTPANWWNSVQIYSRSTAVMSMIGYIIGLGDRHLDNLLINLSTGQVAHIDYNICFEKGHNLRVPERVPFRMTQNLENALGLTRIEGAFRLSCEQVMKILRARRETLLTLLEAFVYDPLLDWTGHDTGIIASFYGGGNAKQKSDDPNASISLQKSSKETRKNQEKKMTFRLYEIRLLENRNLAKGNQEALNEILERLLVKINFLCDLNEKKDLKENLIRLHEQAKIYLDESLTLHSENSKTRGAQHAVYSLHDRYTEYLVYTQNLDRINKTIDLSIEKFESMSKGHSEAIRILKQSLNLNSEEKFRNLIYEEKISGEMERSFECVKEFLNSIGQSAQIGQCEMVYEEISKLEIEFSRLFKQSFELVSKESNLFSYLPEEIKLKSKHVKLLDWLKELRVSNLSAQVLNEVYNKYKNVYNQKFLEEIDLNLLDEKLNCLKNQVTQTELIVSNLNLRKSSLESLESLKLNHDSLLEFSLFGFMGEQLNLEFDVSSQLFESFNFVLLNFLNDNLQKWISMENAAYNAKDQLVSLTSRDGDWYFEEMLSLLLNCNHLTQLIKQTYSRFNRQEEIYFGKSLDMFDSLGFLFEDFKSLLFNFENNLFEKLLKESFSNLNQLDFVLGEFKQMNLEEIFENYQDYSFVIFLRIIFISIRGINILKKGMDFLIPLNKFKSLKK